MTRTKQSGDSDTSGGNLARQAVLHYARELRQYLRRRLGRPQDVDDLAQEVYLRLLRWNEAKVVEKPLAYLYGVASHVVADFHMAAARSAFVRLDDDTLVELPEFSVDSVEDAASDALDTEQQVTRALAQLPPTYAAIVVSYHRDGLTYEEIAQKLNLSVNTVHKYLTRARAQLRMLLAQER